jgi:hypothetical protein
VWVCLGRCVLCVCVVFCVSALEGSLRCWEDRIHHLGSWRTGSDKAPASEESVSGHRDKQVIALLPDSSLSKV